MILSNTLTSLNSIHMKVNKMFNNPNINFFIIMNIILLISCYTFINTPLKNTITTFVSNPIIILTSLILIIIIGYYNINIAILSLLLLFIILFGSTIFNNKYNKKNNNKNNIEGFTDTTDDGDDDDGDDDDGDNDDGDDNSDDNKKHFEKLIKEDKNKSREDSINSFKDVILGSVKKYTNSAENEYKKGLVENKKIIYENEKKNNKANNKVNHKVNHKANNKNMKNGKKSKNGKEEFQTIEHRAFDPSNEDDTNLLITKEVLKDMINRIEYNFETNIYLKKYLKHRIEEIVDINKLVDDEED